MRCPKCFRRIRSAYIRKTIDGKMRWIKVAEVCLSCNTIFPLEDFKLDYSKLISRLLEDIAEGRLESIG